MTPAAIAKVQSALEHIERAQRELERACQELSPVRHGAQFYSRVGKLSLRANEEWHRLERKLDGARRGQTRWPISLDSEPEVRRG